MSKLILKKTDTHVAIKIGNTTGVPVTETITLNSDLLNSGKESILGGAVPTVSIVNIQWTGVSGTTFSISRNSQVIFNGDVVGSSPMNFNEFGYVDNENSTFNIVVTIDGTSKGQLYIGLRKQSGYTTFVENATYGAYDDPTRVGASTTLYGSPDRV